MNDFQRGILKAILTSQLSIETAALESIKSDGDVDSQVGYHLILVQEAKITEITKQIDDINKQSEY